MTYLVAINKYLTKETVEMMIKDLVGYRDNYEYIMIVSSDKVKFENAIKELDEAITILRGE